MNWGPVSKNPHRSQIVSKLQSSAAGRVQCPLPSSRRWSAARRRMLAPSTAAGSGSLVPVAGFDGFGDAEVLIGDGAIRDSGVDERHAHRAMPEQGGDRFEAHPTVDRLGRERVTQLVRMDVTDTGAFGDGGDVAVDRAPIEGLAVVALNEQPGG